MKGSLVEVSHFFACRGIKQQNLLQPLQQQQHVQLLLVLLHLLLLTLLPVTHPAVQTPDLLLLVLDDSDEDHIRQKQVTEETLKELGAGDIPVIYVYNKADLRLGEEELPRVRGDRIYMSARSGAGIPELTDMMFARLKKTGGAG